jgi:Fuc2NAc and GlcNAc transferase
MSWSAWVPSLVITLVCSGLLTGVALHYARRRGLLDLPGPRRSHETPTPRGGGVGLVLALALGLGVAAAQDLIGGSLAAVIVIASLARATLSWIDDHRPVSSLARLSFHFLIAAGALWGLGGLEQLQFGPWQIENVWLRQSLAVIALVWVTNLFNFMDGIDGLAASQTLFCGAMIAFLAAIGGSPELAGIALLVAVSGAGFLPWNFPRARIFMGDVGSATLGFVFGLLCVQGANQGVMPVLVSAMVLALFVTDATATFLYRLLGGHQWYTAHREHAYQLWTRRGWSHVRVVAVAMLLNLAFILPLVWWAHTGPWRELYAAAVLFGGLLALWKWTRVVNRPKEGSGQ